MKDGLEKAKDVCRAQSEKGRDKQLFKVLERGTPESNLERKCERKSASWNWTRKLGELLSVYIIP